MLAGRLRAGDVVLLHDPQTAGMIPRLLETGVPVIWRAHALGASLKRAGGEKRAADLIEETLKKIMSDKFG